MRSGPDGEVERRAKTGCSLSPHVSAMARHDPLRGFRFLLEIDEIASGGFTRAKGLSREVKVESYREGGVNDYVHKMAKETRYPNLTLKRGITDAVEFWDWHQQIVGGEILRKTISVVLLDAQGAEKWRWVFRDAYPVKWNGTDLNATGNTVVVESIEFAHHGLTKGR